MASDANDLFFDALVRHYVEENPRFLRRDWLAARLDEKLHAADRRFVLLTAEPGAGKSAFMAQLAHDHPGWLRYFIRPDQCSVLADVSEKSLLMRIGYQLAARHPELFTQEQLRVSITQRVGEVGEQAEVVAAEVERLIASPFYQKVQKLIEIEQQVQAIQGKVVGLRVAELVVEPRLLPAEDLLYLALIHPAQSLHRRDPGQQIVILIDALDEIRYHPTSENILAWLTSCPHELPENIRFVLTSRPPDEALNLFRAKQASWLSELAIDQNDGHVKQDIERFVTGLIAEPAFAQALGEASGGAQAFARKAIAKAHGNLGYLDALARGIDRAIGEMREKKEEARVHGRRTLDALLSLKELPADLEGLCAFFLHQIKQAVDGQQVVGRDSSGKTYSADVWPAVYDCILGVLAVAAEPLDVELIATLGGIAVDLKWVYPALNRLRQFLDIVDGRYRFYHAMVAEFLTADRTRANSSTADLYQNAQQRHRQIAEHYWVEHSKDWSSCRDGYGLRNLARHLYATSDKDRMQRLICKGWMEARRGEGEQALMGFTDDVALAWQSETGREVPSPETLVRLYAARLLVDEQARAYEDAYLEALVWVDRAGESVGLARCRNDLKARLRGFLTVYRCLTDRQGPTASRYTDPERRDRTIASLAEDLDRTARSIDNPLSRATAFSEIGALLVKNGVQEGNRFFKEAEGIVKTLPDAGERAYGFRTIAVFLAEAGDRRAGAVFSRAARAAHGSSDRRACLQHLAEELRRPGLEGRIQEFIRIINRLESIPDRGYLLGWVSRALISLRRFDEAEKLISHIAETREHVEASCNLARALSATEPARAIRLLHRAAAVAGTNSNRIGRAYELGSVAAELSKLNDPRADELFTASEKAACDPNLPAFNRAFALSHLVVNLVRGGRHDRAKQLAATIRNLNLRMEMNEQLVGSLAGTGRYDDAEKVALSIPHQDAKDVALSRLSSSLIEAAQFERAEEITRSIGQTIGQQERALSELVSALARNGRLDRAIALAQSMPMGRARPEVLARLATVLAKAGDRRAEELVEMAGEATIVRQMGEGKRGHDEALGRMSVGLARIREYSVAEQVARHMDSAEAKGSTFVMLAQALRKPDAKRAEGLLDEAEKTLDAPISTRYAQFLHDLSVDAGKDLVRPNLRRKAARRLRKLSEELAEAGEFHRARNLALSIEDPDEKAAALGYLAAALVRAGSPDVGGGIADAKTAAHAVPDKQRRTEFLVQLAMGVAGAGHKTVEAVFCEAIQAVRDVSKEWDKFSVMCDLAVSSFRWSPTTAHELCSEVLALAQAIQGQSLEDALARAAATLAQAGETGEATKIIAQIQSPALHAKARADVVVRLCEIAELKQAQEAAAEVREEYERARALRHVAVSFIKAKRPTADELLGQAEKTASGIPDKELRSRALSELASNLADLGFLVRAAAVVGKIQTVDIRDRALATLAEYYIGNGKISEALITMAMRSLDRRVDSAGTLDDFLTMISHWMQYLEQAKHGVFLAVLKEAVAVAAWIRPDWARIDRLLSGTSGERD